MEHVLNGLLTLIAWSVLAKGTPFAPAAIMGAPVRFARGLVGEVRGQDGQKRKSASARKKNPDDVTIIRP